MVEINFFAGSKHLLPGAEVGSKLTYLVATIGGHVTAHLPPAPVVVKFKTKQNSIWSKALAMPLTIRNLFSFTSRRSSSVRIGFYLPVIDLLKNCQAATFCHQLFQQVANGILRWQICYLLLLISNPGSAIRNIFVQENIISIVYIKLQHIKITIVNGVARINTREADT